MLHDRHCGGNMHRGWKHVIRRLPAIHVVVRMHLARFTALAPHQFARPVRDHLVEVHVGLRAGARLPHGKREFIGMFAGQDLVGGGNDRLRFVGIEHLEFGVYFSRCPLHDRECIDQFRRLFLARNLEVLQGALRLRAPEF